MKRKHLRHYLETIASCLVRTKTGKEEVVFVCLYGFEDEEPGKEITPELYERISRKAKQELKYFHQARYYVRSLEDGWEKEWEKKKKPVEVLKVLGIILQMREFKWSP